MSVISGKYVIINNKEVRTCATLADSHRHLAGKDKATSAGFFVYRPHSESIRVSGRSMTLGLSSRQSDAELVKEHLKKRKKHV